jgi:excinuclease ABC subunit C
MVHTTKKEDLDVFGLARNGDQACVQVFFVRRGRLIGRESFFLDRLLGVTDGDILSAFVRQFYAANVQPARELLLSGEVPEADLVTEWLGQRRGARVELAVPQRGRKRELVAMAEENAALALQAQLLSRSSRRQVVAEDLMRALGLPGPPNRIEGFDISNIQGSEAVGSMVVWETGTMKKDDYKRFRIRTVPGADDYGMMAEVLRRRYAKALEEGSPLPDLILLDGGRGQLNVGVRVLEELGLDFLAIVSLAKRAEEVYHPGSLQPLALDLASPALQTLQRVRDEAHRFAVTYHKKLRQKRTLQSVLDQIPGVGPTLRTSLLRHLGSARRVRAASVAELAAVPKVTPKLAQRIHGFFHPSGEGADPVTGTGPPGVGPSA